MRISPRCSASEVTSGKTFCTIGCCQKLRCGTATSIGGAFSPGGRSAERLGGARSDIRVDILDNCEPETLGILCQNFPQSLRDQKYSWQNGGGPAAKTSRTGRAAAS